MDTAAATRVPRQRGAHEGPGHAAEAGGCDDARLEFTPEDIDRERRILNLTEQMLACRSIDMRRAALRQLEIEIKRRSPNAVAVLEAQKGLA